jgi:hypothetical protein
MIIERRKPGDAPWPSVEMVAEADDDVASFSDPETQAAAMSKKSFVPSKPILLPLPDENLVSYGDRLLWHQLGLQLNGRYSDMLTEEEYVVTVRGFYPDGLEHNVRQYRSYFNSRQATMGFREVEMPIAVRFKEGGHESD